MIFRKGKTFFKLLMYGIKSIKCVNKAKFYTAQETVDIICKKKLSIIRLGDGEFNILQGKSVSYQPWSKELQENMEEIVMNYINGDMKYLLCMPGEFFLPNAYKLSIQHLKSWVFSRYFFKKKYDIANIVYGDAFLFARGNQAIFKKIWLSQKLEKIIFVHNDEKYAKNFLKKYGIKTIFISVPKEDAYSKIELIKEKICKEVAEKSLVLISAGPAAKIIVKDLSKKGIWCIDTGHCWDTPLLLRK